MSSVAIIAIGCASGGSLVMAAALMALGIGLASGLGLFSLSKADSDCKEKMLAEVNNVIYGVRSEIGMLEASLQTGFSGDINRLNRIEEGIRRALAIEKHAEIEKSVLALNECVNGIRQRIKLSQNELDLEVKRIAGRLRKIFASLKERSISSRLKKEFDKALEIDSLIEKKKMLLDIEKRLAESVKQSDEDKGSEIERSEEERLKSVKADAPDRSLIVEIQDYAEMIRNIDDHVYTEIRALINGIEEERYLQRLEMVRDNIKVRYGKVKEDAAWTSVYKETLCKIREKVASFENSRELLAIMGQIMDERHIDKNEYESILKRATEFIIGAEMKRETASRLRQNLEGLGYSVIGGDETGSGIEKEEVVYLDTRWDGYKVLAKFTVDGELSTRIVRVVSSEEEKSSVSTYQRQKDKEIARQWCKDYDRFLENLRYEGLATDIKLRKEPDTEEVIYIIDKNIPGLASKADAKEGLLNSRKK